MKYLKTYENFNGDSSPVILTYEPEMEHEIENQKTQEEKEKDCKKSIEKIELFPPKQTVQKTLDAIETENNIQHQTLPN
ncbi:hypothetical protein F0919_00760 [Taibaiella lutea]|uniref:Uncharacterized protein n=1 Tax=Taibaiella lutea TaxID=2608001 RepID=A0A5M6CSU8_9BACT|nr:hypothetical protein [Taibaiella lutea]KAA5536229.1 hypothetical protein F0919_00760 [Taibaiella lutea]